MLEAWFRPHGYNLAVNAGDAAEQMVTLAHLHMIPRCACDAPDPVGEIRSIIPERARDREPA